MRKKHDPEGKVVQCCLRKLFSNSVPKFIYNTRQNFLTGYELLVFDS